MKLKKFKSLQELFRAKSRWHQGGMWRHGSHGKVAWCLLGACEEVYGNQQIQPCEKIRAAIAKLFPRAPREYTGEIQVGRFNDNPRRTIQQIRKVVKEAGV